ncbi:MAG: glycosyltransferase family 2 protein, partial [Clostridia bacterium]|nr:glycosyltransferase family 2 protein [Clostridia bacterium]
MITIFTPTYNRCDLLMKLYESIKNQTVKDIEWIIVDDGSSDDTPNIIDNLIKEENEFEIKYFYKENHGRHTAINRGVEEASGEYFMLVDSDDFLPSNAVENILKMFKKIEGKENFACVAGLKA